jgi:predicted XRE-type DNA-binding protein
MKKPKLRSPKVTPEMAAKIKRLLQRPMMQHDIAAIFGINPGRVSEINTGRRFADVPPAREV